MNALLVTSLVAAVAATVAPSAQDSAREARAGLSQLHPLAIAADQEAQQRRDLEARMNELRARRLDLGREADLLEVRMELEVVSMTADLQRRHREQLRELATERDAVERAGELRERELDRAVTRIAQELDRLSARSVDERVLRRELESRLRHRAELERALERALERIPAQVVAQSGERVPNPEFMQMRERSDAQRRDLDADISSIEETLASAQEDAQRRRNLEEEFSRAEEDGFRSIEELRARQQALEYREEDLHDEFELNGRRFELEMDLERREREHALEREGMQLALEMERVERELAALEVADRHASAPAGAGGRDASSQLRAPATASGAPVVVADDLEAARMQAAAKGRLLLVNFTGHTCVNGRFMEEKVFTEPAIRATLANFVEARLHADAPDEEVRARVARHVESLARTEALPVYVVLDPRTGEELGRQEGALRQGGKAFGRFLEKAREKMQRGARGARAEDALLEAVQALRNEVALLRAEIQRQRAAGGGTR